MNGFFSLLTSKTNIEMDTYEWLFSSLISKTNIQLDAYEWLFCIG